MMYLCLYAPIAFGARPCLSVLFAVTGLSNNFPPPYLKYRLAKILIIVALLCFLLSIGAGLVVKQVRTSTLLQPTEERRPTSAHDWLQPVLE